jgi:hypothetical protein
VSVPRSAASGIAIIRMSTVYGNHFYLGRTEMTSQTRTILYLALIVVLAGYLIYKYVI